MIDLKLKRLTLRNWMKFRNVTLDLPESGLILVQGINAASGGALLSVGSGKTGLGEAISRTLLGVPGRFTHLKQFSTDKNGDTYVKVEAELLGKPLIIESGFKCKELSETDAGLRYSYDGKQVARGRIDQTREELSRLLGVSPLLAAWTAFIDGDSIKFNKLSQANCVELVMSSLRQPPWNDYHEASKKYLGKFQRSVATSEATHKNALNALNTAKTEAEFASRHLTLETQRYDQAVKNNEEEIQRLKNGITVRKKDIEAAKLELASIAKKLKLMEDQRATASHKLEIKLHDIEDKLLKAQDARQPLSEAHNKTQQKATEASLAYTNYANAGKNCPTCKRPMGKVDEALLNDLETKWQKARDANQKTGTAWAVAEQKVVTLNLQYRETSKEHREVSAKQDVEHMADRYEELEIGISSATNEINECNLEVAHCQKGPSSEAWKTAEARLADRKTALAKAQQGLDEAAAALAGDQATEQVLKYWNLAFSPYGIPNLILREAVAPLNKEARRVSATMTGGTIEVRFSTIRELASGLEKAQLNIEVDNKLGDKELTGSSKGEAGLTNFIIAETLSEVGQVSRRVGFRWYDEIVPHQDPKVCHNIYSYMKGIAQSLGILVFLVDHNPVAANYADHVLIVEKSGEGDNVRSTARWC